MSAIVSHCQPMEAIFTVAAQLMWFCLMGIPNGSCGENGDKPSDWWFGTFFIFPHLLGIIIPTDFHIFQRVGIPATSHDKPWNCVAC